MIIATGVIADQTTSNGNIYPRESLEKVVTQFNARASKNPIHGKEINRADIDYVGEPGFVTNNIFINNSGVLCADIKFLDTEAGKELEEKIKGSSSVIARPIMTVPKYKVMEQQDPERVSDVTMNVIMAISRIQIECQ